MYIYDCAHSLADEIKKTEEYKEYKALKDEVYSDETNRSLIKQYKKAQFEAQTMILSGQQPSAELMDNLQKVGQILGLNSKVSDFFAAEYKFQTIISDIYKIIGEASEIDTDFFTE